MLDDDLGAVPRTAEYIKMLRETFTTVILWDEYGIIDNVVVSLSRSRELFTETN